MALALSIGIANEYVNSSNDQSNSYCKTDIWAFPIRPYSDTDMWSIVNAIVSLAVTCLSGRRGLVTDSARGGDTGRGLCD